MTAERNKKRIKNKISCFTENKLLHLLLDSKKLKKYCAA
jgi:hypothetical protein